MRTEKRPGHCYENPVSPGQPPPPAPPPYYLWYLCRLFSHEFPSTNTFGHLPNSRHCSGLGPWQEKQRPCCHGAWCHTHRPPSAESTGLGGSGEDTGGRQQASEAGQRPPHCYMGEFPPRGLPVLGGGRAVSPVAAEPWRRGDPPDGGAGLLITSSDAKT